MTRTRVVTALVLAPLAIAGVLLLPTPWFAALLAALFLLGLWEWTRMAGVEEPVARAVLVAANAALMAALTWGGWPALFTLAALAGCVWWLLAALWLARYDFAAADVGWARSLKLLAGTLCVVPAWCAAVLLHADSPANPPLEEISLGPRWMLLAAASVWAADTFAYFAGRYLGRARLAPRISPGKTWAGLWGGLAGAVLVAIGGSFVLGIHADPVRLAALALLAAAFSVVGDLFESLIKRHSGHKDSGALFPGHGGMMDRIDGVLAALPIFVIVKGWLEL